MFSLRRAMLLQLMLDRLPKEQKMDLDHHVLNALLGFKGQALPPPGPLPRVDPDHEQVDKGRSKVHEGTSSGRESQMKLHVGWKKVRKASECGSRGAGKWGE